MSDRPGGRLFKQLVKDIRVAIADGASIVRIY